MKKMYCWIIFSVICFTAATAGGGKDINGLIPSIWDITYMDINNIDIPLENNGSTGDDGKAYYPNGQSSLSFLYSGGFASSGYITDTLRASWMTPSSLLEEWRPGKWGMNPTNPLARFYTVSSSDGPGSQAYVEWTDAVSLGAIFIDRNGDGIYDPNVDKPPVMGDRIIWTVFNDSTLNTYPSGLGTRPLGLEIHQYAWAFARSDLLGDIIFFWHRLINTGGNQIDSLIFSVWEDADIGDYTDDLVGCDSTLSLGYCYNDGNDINYGSNPPAFGVKLLQGPVVDSPGDTAFVYRGPSSGIDTLLDRRNLSMTSFMHYIYPLLPAPSNAKIARYYQKGGLDAQGYLIDPTHWGIGGTSTTNPKFFYSGNPVIGTGWLDINPGDKRFLVNSGPFDLAPGDTQDIVFAYVVRQGSNSLNSVQWLKQAAGFLNDFFPDSSIIVSIDQEPRLTIVPKSFKLFQNYPNPFNPSTTFRYDLPKTSKVVLKIYNVFGQEVRTLINERQSAGAYHLQWGGLDRGGERVASGIYFYQLKVGNNFSETKKMILMR